MTASKNILLVDDDPDDRFFFNEAIREIKNAVVIGVAKNGKEALDTLKNTVILPDFIFMDINMPVMNGMKCLEEIVKKPELKNIPVIMFSSSVAEAALAHQIGAKAYIKKSSDSVSLRTKLEQIINLDFSGINTAASKTFRIAFSGI